MGSQMTTEGKYGAYFANLQEKQVAMTVKFISSSYRWIVHKRTIRSLRTCIEPYLRLNDSYKIGKQAIISYLMYLKHMLAMITN